MSEFEIFIMGCFMGGSVLYVIGWLEGRREGRKR